VPGGQQVVAAAGLPVGTVTYGYNANGEQTSNGTITVTYNAAHQTRTITEPGKGTTTYTYDGNGNRVTATLGTTTTKYVWDTLGGLPNLVLERDGTNTMIRRYVYGPDRVLSTDTPTATSYYLTDTLGSVTNLVGPTGIVQATYTYDPWGAARTTTITDPTVNNNPLKYTGQYLDATSNYHLRARQYNPTLGQFTQTDPMPMGLGSPFESAFVYVGDRPTFLIDPSGMRGQESGFAKQAKEGALEALSQISNVATLDNTVGVCGSLTAARNLSVVFGGGIEGGGCLLDDGHQFGVALIGAASLGVGIGMGGFSAVAGPTISNAKNMTDLLGYGVCSEVNVTTARLSGAVSFCYSLDGSKVTRLNQLDNVLFERIPEDWILHRGGKRVWSLFVGLGKGKGSGAVDGSVGLTVTQTSQIYGWGYDPSCRTGMSGAVRTVLGWGMALPTAVVGQVSCATSGMF
jgi:RHS repeat-associated protein